MAFRRHYFYEFAEELRASLRATIPNRIADFSDDQLHAEIIRLIELFHRHEIKSKKNIQRLVYLRFVHPKCLTEPLPRTTLFELTFPDKSEEDKTNELFFTVMAQNE